MNGIIIALLFLTPVKKGDSWLGRDKLLHIVVSSAIVGLAYHTYHCEFRNPNPGARMFSISLSGVAGVGKEVWDKFDEGCPSLKDIVADFVGIGLGVFIFTYY
jgi:uncharacterized protein YfiM (DUF2279 family)